MINSVTNVTYTGIKFTSSVTDSFYPLVLINESGPVNGLTFTDCEWTAPSGNYNAVNIIPWASGGNAVVHQNIRFIRPYMHDLGRMGIEVVAHSWDNVIRARNIIVEGGVFENLGINAIDGMAVSFSGEIENVRLTDCRISEFKNYGVEFIGTRNFVAANNQLTTTKTSNGYNITDGGNTDGGNPGHLPP